MRNGHVPQYLSITVQMPIILYIIPICTKSLVLRAGGWWSGIWPGLLYSRYVLYMIRTIHSCAPYPTTEVKIQKASSEQNTQNGNDADQREDIPRFMKPPGYFAMPSHHD